MVNISGSHRTYTHIMTLAKHNYTPQTLRKTLAHVDHRASLCYAWLYMVSHLGHRGSDWDLWEASALDSEVR